METLSKVPPKRRRKPKATADAKSPGTNPHDKFARKTMGDPVIAADVLRHYTDPVVSKYVDLDGLKPEPTQNFGKAFKEFIKDISFVSHLIDKKGKSEVLIVAEHKSLPEPFVMLQLLVYLSLTWYKRWCDAGRPQSTKKFRLPAPILVVLYNGKSDWVLDLSIKDLVAAVPPELEQFIPEVKVILIRLNRFDIHNLPGRPETQAVIESMIRATSGTFVAGLESIFGHFRGTTLDDRIQELIGDIVHYCDQVEEVTPGEVDKAIIKSIQGEESKMSKAVAAVRKAFAKMAEEYVKNELKAEQGKGTLLKILRARFKRVPRDVENAISKMTDPVALDSWAVHAATCESMDEFAQSIR